MRALLQKVDSMPDRAPWMEQWITFKDRPGEKHLVQYRDIIIAIKALLGNPAHADKIVYRPSHVFTEESRKGRVYTEMWTGNWWHAVQVRQHEHGLRVLVHLYLTPQHRVSSPRAPRLRPSLFPPTKPSSHNFRATDRRTRST